MDKQLRLDFRRRSNRTAKPKQIREDNATFETGATKRDRRIHRKPGHVTFAFCPPTDVEWAYFLESMKCHAATA